MKIVTVYRSAALLIITAFISVSPSFAQRRSVELRVLGTYSAGAYNQGASEIVAHDPFTQRLFTVNGATSKIDVLGIANPSAPTLLFSIDLAPYGRTPQQSDGILIQSKKSEKEFNSFSLFSSITRVIIYSQVRQISTALFKFLGDFFI